MSKKEFTATEEALDTFIDDAGFNVDAVSTVEVETFKKTNKENKERIPAIINNFFLVLVTNFL